ncbi:MAG: hypothetical protein GOV15_03770 [Candidatus Diapherotrites archaeon]|nr:hypothetical protein [Candidatus Diapherotrites archaeon]
MKKDVREKHAQLQRVLSREANKIVFGFSSKGRTKKRVKNVAKALSISNEIAKAHLVIYHIDRVDEAASDVVDVLRRKSSFDYQYAKLLNRAFESHAKSLKNLGVKPNEKKRIEKARERIEVEFNKRKPEDDYYDEELERS